MKSIKKLKEQRKKEEIKLKRKETFKKKGQNIRWW